MTQHAKHIDGFHSPQGRRLRDRLTRSPRIEFNQAPVDPAPKNRDSKYGTKELRLLHVTSTDTRPTDLPISSAEHMNNPVRSHRRHARDTFRAPEHRPASITP